MKIVFNILLSLFLLNLITGCTELEEPEDDIDFIDRNYYLDYNWIESNNEGISLLVNGRVYLPIPPRILNNKELVTDKSRYVMTEVRIPTPNGNDTFELSFIDNIEYFSIAFYDPSDKSLIQEIDLTDFLLANAEYKMGSSGFKGYQDIEGNNFVSGTMYKLTDRFENGQVILSETLYQLLIDVETYDIKIAESELDLLYYLTDDRLGLIDGTNIAAQNGVEIKYVYNNFVHEIRIERDKLPKNNDKLNGLFIDLENDITNSIKNSPNTNNTLSFYFFDPKNSLEILSYFVEDDKEIEWEGIILGERLTIDGTEREIRSVEEFIQFYKYNNPNGTY